MVNIQQYWPVNIITEDVEISDEDNKELIEVARKYIEKYAHIPDVLDPNREGYNFLDDEAPIVRKLEAHIKSRTYLMMEAEGFIDPMKYQIEVVCSARMFHHGERAKAHNHRGCDYVAVYYADLDVVAEDENNFLEPKGRLLITDPISMRSRALNHTQNIDIVPRPKFFIMHPSYLYHQSEPYLGQRERVFFVFVIRIVEQIHQPHYKRL